MTQSKRSLGGDYAVFPGGGGRRGSICSEEQVPPCLPAVSGFRNIVAVTYDPTGDA